MSKVIYTIYGEWDCVAEKVNRQSAVVSNYYVWGLDLSGSLQGAGGIGGLVCVVNNSERYFPCYDGNSNVTDYTDISGVVVAHYEYDPFGRTVVSTGPMEDAFNFRFSTKYNDNECEVYYYGYRYYRPGMGRWLSRDPIGELVFVEQAIARKNAGEIRILLRVSPEARIVLQQSDRHKAKLSRSLRRELMSAQTQGLLALRPYDFLRNDPIDNQDYLGESPLGLIIIGVAAVDACCIYYQVTSSGEHLNGTAKRSWWVHCLAACRISRRCLGVGFGTIFSYYMGMIHEYLNPSGDRDEDLMAFAYGGWTAALDGVRSCEAACSIVYPYGPNDPPPSDPGDDL